jgi:hypothetical protein
MSTVISHGVPTTLKANVVYALPSELTFVTAAAAVSTSLDGVAWTALANAITGAITGSMFIKAAADTLVVTREATNMIQVPGSGGLPTAPTGQVLISQGAGVPPIFSATPVVTTIEANGSLLSRYVIYCAEGNIASSYAISPGERTVASQGPGDIRGRIISFNDSAVTAWGSVVVGGGTHFVLARWDGTNWRVVSSDTATVTSLSLPEREFADLTSEDKVKGTIVNIKNSKTDNPGQTVIPGGTESVLARYDGTNWIVII